MIEAMYYDTFTEEYTLKRDPYAAPERYVRTYRGISGICEETWNGEVDGKSGYALTVAYFYEEYYTEARKEKLAYMCERYGFKPTHLRDFVLPPERFDECVRMFGLESEEAGA